MHICTRARTCTHAHTCARAPAHTPHMHTRARTCTCTRPHMQSRTRAPRTCPHMQSHTRTRTPRTRPHMQSRTHPPRMHTRARALPAKAERDGGPAGESALLAGRPPGAAGVSSAPSPGFSSSSQAPVPAAPGGPHCSMMSLRFSCRIVSLTAWNTKRMFSVSMAVVKWWNSGRLRLRRRRSKHCTR